ncbi:MAG: hypothetical protein ABSE45_14940 [Candidatus Acidiferrales bacterium]|jgi:hypothetical protein
MDSLVRLTAEVLRQLPYATNAAITRTAKEAVAAAQREAGERLQIRKNFILKRIRILQYSRVGNLTAVIGVDRNVQGSPLILGFLESGQSGEKTGSGGEGVAVPLTGSPARPSFPQSVPASLRYTNLKLVNRKGRKSTYVVPGVGVFERLAAGGRKWDRASKRLITVDQSDTVEIYAFKPSVPLATHVHLREAMLAVISQRFAAIFTEEFEKEIRARAAHLSR